MINAFLVFNNTGQPRLTKFYIQLETSVQQRLISEIFSLVSHRPVGSSLIDLIQVFVEALDRLFENVCELDLIFNFETLHACLGEMIVGGMVVETSLDKVVEGVRAQGKVPRRPVNDAVRGASTLGSMTGNFGWAAR